MWYLCKVNNNDKFYLASAANLSDVSSLLTWQICGLQDVNIEAIEDSKIFELSKEEFDLIRKNRKGEELPCDCCSDCPCKDKEENSPDDEDSFWEDDISGTEGV